MAFGLVAVLIFGITALLAVWEVIIALGVWLCEVTQPQGRKRG